MGRAEAPKRTSAKGGGGAGPILLEAQGGDPFYLRLRGAVPILLEAKGGPGPFYLRLSNRFA